MGTIDKYYSLFNNLQPLQENKKIVKVEEPVRLKVLNDSRDITLCEKICNSVKVHRFSNYRKKERSMLLLPNIEAEIDRLL